MKFINSLIVFASAAAAVPTDLTARQLSSRRNDLEDGSSSNCPSAILIYARATGEIGNMVRVLVIRAVSFITDCVIVGIINWPCAHRVSGKRD